MSDDPECPFCQIARGTAAADILYRTDDVMVFMPDEPATPGHTLVVPIHHIPTIWDLDEETAAHVTAEVMHTAKTIRELLRPDGMNIIQSNGAAASQTVFHLHVHVLPRTERDRVGDFWPEGSSMTRAEKLQLSNRMAARMNMGTDESDT